jgi:hypothetical protein
MRDRGKIFLVFPFSGLTCIGRRRYLKPILLGISCFRLQQQKGSGAHDVQIELWIETLEGGETDTISDDEVGGGGWCRR